MKRLLFLTSLICLGTVLAFSSCEKEDDDGVVEGAPTVITMSTCEINPQSTLISGECTNQGNSAVTAKGMIWSTSSELTMENKLGFTNHGPDIGTFKSSVSNLTPLTTYYFRAYATNTQGTGYGIVASFTTPAK